MWSIWTSVQGVFQYDDNLGSQELKLPYGSWLRAEDEKVKLPPVEIILNRNSHNKIFFREVYGRESVNANGFDWSEKRLSK